MTTLQEKYDHWCDEDENLIHRMFSNQPEKLNEAIFRHKMAKDILDNPLKSSDTYYFEIKALEERCLKFIDSVYDDYHEELLVESFIKALEIVKKGNLSGLSH